MRRFYIAPDAVHGKRMVFKGDDARYICRVLRLKRGEGIIAFDGQGNEYAGTIGILSPRRVEAIIMEVSQKTPTRPYRVALAQSLLKGAALELVLRQTTEAGISDFYPFSSARSVAGGFLRARGKQERWRKIVVDAVRQSGQDIVPAVHQLRDWKELLQLAGEYDLCLLPWEGEKAKSLKAALEEAGSPEKILVAIGPEGGFADSEVAEAAGAGFMPVNLGPSIYRASTAGLATISAVHYHFQPAG